MDEGDETQAQKTQRQNEEVSTFKTRVTEELRNFSRKFDPEAKLPSKAVADTVVNDIIQPNLRGMVININTAYTMMVKAIAATATVSIAIMQINNAVNSIFGILYALLTSQVEIFQEDVKEVVETKRQSNRTKTPASAIKGTKSKTGDSLNDAVAVNITVPVNGQAAPIQIFPVSGLAMAAGGGLVNNDSQTKGKSKNKDTRSFKVKSDKKTSRKK
jgi:hypothetical protein